MTSHLPELIIVVILLLLIVAAVFSGLRVLGSSIGRSAAREIERLRREEPGRPH